MATVTRYTLFTLFVVVFAHYSTSITTLESTEGCQEKCEGEVSPSAAPSGEELQSCLRGCRFYTLTDFIQAKKPTENKESTFTLCQTSCSEAYGAEGSNLDLCNKGCFFEEGIKRRAVDAEEGAIAPPAEGAEEGAEGVLQSISSLTPVMQVRKVVSDVVGGFMIMSSQVVTYFVRDDNTLVAVGSEPQVFVQTIEKEEESHKNAIDNIAGLSPSEWENNNDLFQREDTPLGSPSETVSRVSLNSRRYSYLLHLIFLLGIVSLTLLGISYCMALARHQQRKTLKAANLNLALRDEPLKLVRPEDLTKLSLMEEEEAPPLPQKQDLYLNHANV